MSETTLDEKLREIAERIRDGGMNSGWNYDVDEAMEEIKQAFIDAGWVVGRIATEVNGSLYIVNGVDPIRRYDGATLLTGQEWYNRFEAEVDAMSMEPPIVDGAYLEAAKKAAGIKEDVS